MEFAEAQKHVVRISGPSLIKQAVQNRNHPLDMVREALSNSCLEQVGATKVILSIHKHPDYGATFSFFDNGIGMDYTTLSRCRLPRGQRAVNWRHSCFQRGNLARLHHPLAWGGIRPSPP
jgi:hypothetical protein